MSGELTLEPAIRSRVVVYEALKRHHLRLPCLALPSQCSNGIPRSSSRTIQEIVEAEDLKLLAAVDTYGYQCPGWA